MIELKPAINEVKLTLKSISSPINLGTVVEPVSGGTVPTDVRQAIYTLLENAAYVTTGLEDEIAIVQAWAQEVTALTLSATSLSLNNSTPQTLVATVVPATAEVVWSSSDESIATVSNGVVTGVNNGSCVITATAGGKTANCAVTVSGFATLESISAVYTQSGTVYDTDSLDDLKADLVVTATYSDTSTATVPSTSYSLSGTLEVGTSTITVTYQGKTTTFNVTVTECLVPSGYKQVQYLEATQYSSKNGVYFDTGVNLGTPTLATFRMGIQYITPLSPWSGTIYPIGARQNSADSVGWASGLGSNQVSLNSWSGSGSAVWTPSDPTEINNYHDVVATHTSSAVTVTVDSNPTVSASITTRACNGSDVSIFGLQRANKSEAEYLFNGRIYYAEAETDGNVLFSYVPCIRKSDNAIGFYDTISNSFKAPSLSGTGTLSCLTVGL